MTNDDGLESFEARPTQAEIDERDRPQINAARVAQGVAAYLKARRERAVRS